MDKEQTAIERLRLASRMSMKLYQKPLMVTTSGGKDSSVCVALAYRAGIPFEVVHNHTTADAPETVYFVRSEFERLAKLGIQCTTSEPVCKGELTSMWRLIPLVGVPPTRTMRYCCSILKERSGAGRFIVTGVRWAESKKRENKRGVYEALPSDLSKKIILNNDNDERRRDFETCYLKSKRVCNPIIDWTDADVWDYLKSEGIPVNPLYECGFSRVGCIGCPLASKKRWKEFARYPKYKDMYIQAFKRMLEKRKKPSGQLDEWSSADEVFHWWMEDGILPGQIGFDDLEEDL